MKGELKTKKGLITGLAALRRQPSETGKVEMGENPAEDELRAIEERYRTILESIEDGYYEVDLTGKFTFLNEWVLKHIGYSRKEMLGRRYQEFTDKENAASVLKVFNNVFISGKPDRGIDWIIIKKDGSRKIVEASVSLIRDLAGSPVGFRGIVRDITERKRAERALRESEERYRKILEDIEEGYYEVDLAGNYTFFNPSLAKILGYTEEEMTGMNYRTYIDKGSAKNVFRYFNEVYRTGISARLDYGQIRKDGSEMCVETSVALMRDSFGKPIGFRGIVRDVTERKRLEEALRQAESDYRSIFENAQEAIYRSTLGGKVIVANQSLADILGYDSPRDIINNINDISRQVYVNPRDREVLLRILKESGFARNFECEFYRKDGSKIWVSMTVSNVCDSEGTVQYLEGIAQDISIRKLAEEEHERSFERIRRALKATVEAIAVMVETRDPYTAGHQRRVSDLARAIATEMNLSTDKIDGIRTAAIIHDIGKISVPAEILTKPTKLTDLEFGIIKTHVQSGYDILKDIEFPWPVARMILEHHERMDGSGYPNRLCAEETLLESRILSVADVVESMASHRPYRPSLGIGAGLTEITKNKGVYYDTEVVDACLQLFYKKGYKLKG